MFKLSLYDRAGNKLQLGDIVKVSNGREVNFYCEVKYLEDEKVITPFHTFSFHSFEKVDKVPDHAIKSDEERYNIWFTNNLETDNQAAIDSAKDYLISWRQCEHLLENSCFRIELDDQHTVTNTSNQCRHSTDCSLGFNCTNVGCLLSVPLQQARVSIS